MNNSHQVSDIKISDGLLRLSVDGKIIERELAKLSPVLAKASHLEQAEFEVSPSGYGIHWPLIDEDLSIDGLLGISHRPDSRKKIA